MLQVAGLPIVFTALFICFMLSVDNLWTCHKTWHWGTSALYKAFEPWQCVDLILAPISQHWTI